MNRTIGLLFAMAAIAICTAPAIAHHSVSAEFNPDKVITLKGVISKVDWINPHIYVYLDVKDESGKTTTWMLQSLPPMFFRGSGLTKDALLNNKQEATVNAFPAKDGTKAYGFLLKMSYPDGHFYSFSPQSETPGGT
jgi:Family of unknown function (DUF6152)